MVLMELICIDANGHRRVNNLEIKALEFTFGKEVGNWLIGIIKIKYNPRLILRNRSGEVAEKVNGKTNRFEITIGSDYIPGNLWWLGSFIHEATHIWQLNTCRHLEGIDAQDKEYEYNARKFPDLKVEQHAKAVEHWFFADYGSTCNLLDKPYQMKRTWLWDEIRRVSVSSVPDLAKLDDPVEVINDIWKPVIEEIRDPTHIPDIPGKICEELKDPPAG